MQGSSDFKITSGLLIVALTVGGAGLSFPLLQMLLGICALAAGGYFVCTPQARLSPYGRVALALAASILALTLLQLVPLPPFVWHRLPGRELPARLDDILISTPWRPWTLDVEATIRSLLVLIPPVVILVGCLRVPTPERTRLLWIVIGFALIDAVFGMIQFATGGRLTPYPSAHSGYPIGLFVNRNHNAVMLLVSMPIAAALGAVQIGRGRARLSTIAATLSVIAILAMVVIGTTSRMALVLLPVSLAASLYLLFLGQSLWRMALPSVLALAALAVVILVGGGFSHSLTRFSSLHDSRFDYWTDVSWALGHYGLAGTGFGTFVPVYQSAESLDAVTPAILNHAHNDYIEILLEGGVPAIILLLLFFAFLGVCAAKLARSRITPERAVVSLAAAAGVFIFLVFSLVDYPLRMPALSCVFAILCTLLLPRTHAATQRQIVKVDSDSEPAAALRRRARLSPGRLAALAVLAGTAILVVQAGVSSHSMLAQRNFEAMQWAPWSTQAHERAATDELLQGNAGDAVRNAEAAIALSPISAPAIRTIGLVHSVRSAGDGSKLMDVAATLGWRDPITQLWAIDAAKRSGEPQKAIERAGALYRQHQFAPGLLAVLSPPASPRLISLLVTDLARRPEWRRELLRAGGELPPALLDGFEGVVVQLGATGSRPTTDETGPLVDRLLLLGRTDDARHLWSSVHGNQLILNGDFERVDTGRGANLPADWDISDEDIPALDVGRPEAGRQNRALRIYSTRGSAPIISQQLMLLPGSYVLSFSAHESPGSGSILRWEVRCVQSGLNVTADATPSGATWWQQFTVGLTVPNQNCPVQRLALERLGDIHPHELWIDNVALKQVPG